MQNTLDWQPARLKRVHPNDTPEFGGYAPEDELQHRESLIVRVRPYTGAWDLQWLRDQTSCPDGVKFYDVDLGSGYCEWAVVCEHEVFTD